MKLAVIGSRGITDVDFDKYITEKCVELVSGGARGVDALVRDYAIKKGIKIVEFKPDYEKFGKGAPLKRNEQIVNYADRVLAFWDGSSRGTSFTVEYCKRQGKPCEVIIIKKP